MVIRLELNHQSTGLSIADLRREVIKNGQWWTPTGNCIDLFQHTTRILVVIGRAVGINVMTHINRRRKPIQQ
jgi:hypothetical protein